MKPVGLIRASMVILISLLALATPLAPVVAGARQAKAVVVLPPRQPFRGSTSYALNWAGYADVVAPGTVTMANASWIVPQVTGKANTYVAIWVGIDGFNDSTVEQTGILAEVTKRGTEYYAWYEFYPASPVYAPSNDTVEPGDKIVAWVVYNPSTGKFRTVLEDYRDGRLVFNYTSPWTAVSGAERSSAEWIVERPAIGNSLTQLADFGRAYFGYDYTGVLLTDYATINGVSGPISAFNYTAIVMVNNRGQTLAYPSALSSDGTSFYVTYVASS